MRYAVCQILLALLLVSCSDSDLGDDINGNNTLAVYSTVEDLPPCTIKNEGEQLFVKSEGIIRVCADEKWFATMERGGGCSTEMLKDSSGLKIVCDGDSVGVVLNGKNGSNGKNGILPDSSENDDVVLDSEKVATSLEGVSGYSQKGPFINGSKVTVIELESGRTLNQTGNTFESKIQSDDGQFKLNARMMVSQYVELHAEGYYRNEVSGINSEAPLTLYALTDVRKRDGGIVNINLLTHLEYHRVVYLVKNKKMKVAAAKDSAEKEIFGLLNINSKDFFSSEDLNIAGSSEGDAALLAFSVMFQGNRGVADLTKLLTDVATDIEKDGSWDDATAKAEIADWAENADATGRLETIRANVGGWGLSSMVPNFEKYIRSFWAQEYGLPSCDKANVDTLLAAGAKRLAESKNRYVCVDSAGVGYMWRRATDLEKDTYGWAAGSDGQIKNGDINTAVRYVYDAAIEKWREMTELEEVYGVCTRTVEADPDQNTLLRNDWESYMKKEGKPYLVCENRQWVDYHLHDVDTRSWENASDGTFRKGIYMHIGYVFDDALGYWRVAWENEVLLEKGCTSSNYAEVAYHKGILEDTYYVCDRNYYEESLRLPDQGLVETYDKHKYYDPTDYWWVKTDKDVAENTFGESCDYEKNGRIISGKIKTDSYFVCDNLFWRKASPEEEITGEACLVTDYYPRVLENFGETMTCERGEWRSSIVYDFDVNDVPEKFFKEGFSYGTLYDERDGRTYKTIQIDLRNSTIHHVSNTGNAMGEPMEWMAQNLNFAGNDDYPNLTNTDYFVEDKVYNNYCYQSDPLNCIKGGRFYTWTAAMNIDDKWQKGNAHAAGKIQEQHQGVCPDGWHIPSVEDWILLSDATATPDLVAIQSSIKDATNLTGFSAINTAGLYNLRTVNSFFEKNDIQLSWWSASEKTNTRGYSFNIFYSGDSGQLTSNNEDFDKTMGLPVRCVKNYTLDGD